MKEIIYKCAQAARLHYPGPRSGLIVPGLDMARLEKPARQMAM